MTIADIISAAEARPLLVLKKDQLGELLEKAEILFEKDTCISDYIRILRYQHHFFTQEISNKGEVILRFFQNYEDAQSLVNDHLRTYEMMWDGCGCKINYYS